jgi:hypothetical protein
MYSGCDVGPVICIVRDGVIIKGFGEEQQGHRAGFVNSFDMLTLHGALIPMPRRAEAIFPANPEAFDII